MSSRTGEEDAELSAALGWPGGISEPLLDRAALLRMVGGLRAELASMRRRFEAADRERSELRARAERAEAERDALRAALNFIADHDLRGADLTVAGHIAHALIGKARAALTETQR
jgi:hypothetical protein